MKKRLRNKDGYRTLKLRLLIVLCMLGGYAYIAYDLFMEWRNPSIVFILALAVIVFSIIFLSAPIKIRHNGYEQSV